MFLLLALSEEDICTSFILIDVATKFCYAFIVLLFFVRTTGKK